MSKEQKAKFATKEAAAHALFNLKGDPLFKWSYRDAEGEIVCGVFQWGEKTGKRFCQISRLASGEWIIGTDGQKHPLYRLNEIVNQKEKTVFVCEGEKSADAAHEIGLLATTSLCGSNSYKKTNWKPLAGRTVFILPDNDEPGEKYAEDVAELLARLRPAARVKILHVPSIQSIGDKADIADRLKRINETEVNP